MAAAKAELAAVAKRVEQAQAQVSLGLA